MLTTRDGVHSARLPEGVPAANTAVDWSGARWTMILWPLPDEPAERTRLLAHEMWHRVQNGLGLPASMPTNAHLDSEEGRIWLRLEWRALREALSGQGEPRRSAVADALLFRARRRSIFGAAAAEERALELNEGLAEYTGSC